ncbi:MAG: ABC transporter transmembrane domain-containing protein [bacterium]
MLKNKEQALLYKYRNQIKQSLMPTQIGSARFRYLFKFLKEQNLLLFFVFVFLFLQTMLEIALLLLANNSLQSIFIYSGNHQNIFFASIILLACILYTIFSFLAVRYERTLVLNLINDLRKKLFTENLDQEESSNTHEVRANFIAKISYHLSLLTMGIDNTLLSSVRWLLYIVVLFVFSIVNHGQYLLLIFIVFVSSLILFFISYLLSKRYISRQVASYSRVIRHLVTMMLEIPLIKNFHKEKVVEEKLDGIVGVDTYFRIIRDTWIRYSSRVVFVLIIGLGAFYLLLTSYYPVVSLGKISQIFIKGIVYIYAIRILYSSTKAGLYFLPLKLGIVLSVPEKIIKPLVPRNGWVWKKINFKSNKVKLFSEGEYYKNISLEFEKGGRYLFIGKYQSGKTHLAAMLAGQGYFSRHSWIVKMDKEHLGYNSWAELFKENYFFMPHFSTDLTVGEIILGKEREDIKEEDISLVDKLSIKYPIFLSIFSKTRFIGESARIFESSSVSMFAIQVAYTILNKPKVIVIDNAWVDLCYNEIKELLQIMEKELPNSIIIVFSRNKNLIISYKEIYEISKTSIQKI